MNETIALEKEIETLQEIKCDFENKCCSSIDLGNIEAINTAISALEYRIPKKPAYEGNGCDKNGELIYDNWICPHCNNEYEVDYDYYDFCPKCGQAIDWGDEQ